MTADPPAADDADFDRRLLTEKLAALAEFAAGAGHEIHNPLATIVGRVQLLLQEESHPERRRSLGIIRARALRVRDMIGDLMLFARPPEPKPVPCAVEEIAHSAVSRLTSLALDAETELLLTAVSPPDDTSGPLFADCDPEHLLVILTELIHNAIDAGQAGQVTVRLSSTSSAVVIEVCDDGEAWTETDRRHAFDPFYSGRAAGRGLGFGLSKCWRLVTLAGGSISLPVTEGPTSAVRVELPRSAAGVPPHDPLA